eukprot:CAMPEP_0170573702 /NCGR_PEP_ID=MMETSP0224-20130122/2904_1 /TAXON_ID=285029 /ORGANISM="Togula jolla, Strain CCCM 725" /LENGTH=83 /DNA_ID=CAMNT_0010896303 /DNA_START=1301 /DNA_END=1549 /DNA_ORIENTATION=+
MHSHLVTLTSYRSLKQCSVGKLLEGWPKAFDMFNNRLHAHPEKSARRVAGSTQEPPHGSILLLWIRKILQESAERTKTYLQHV